MWAICGYYGYAAMDEYDNVVYYAHIKKTIKKKLLDGNMYNNRKKCGF